MGWAVRPLGAPSLWEQRSHSVIVKQVDVAQVPFSWMRPRL